MKIKIDYNHLPLRNFVVESAAIISEISFTEEKSYKICKGTPYAMTVTTDIVEPLKHASKEIGLLFVRLVKDVNKK